MAEVTWHLEAAEDLAAAAAYIGRDSPTIAASFVRRIAMATRRLAEYPMLGRAVPELHDASFRELIFQNYRIVYRTIGGNVAILGVIHAAMDMERQQEVRGWELT